MPKHVGKTCYIHVVNFKKCALFGVIEDKSNSVEEFFSTAETVLFSNIRLMFAYTSTTRGTTVTAMEGGLGNAWE